MKLKFHSLKAFYIFREKMYTCQILLPAVIRILITDLCRDTKQCHSLVRFHYTFSNLGSNLLFPHTKSTKNLIKFLCDFVYETSLQVKKRPSSSLCTGRINTINLINKKDRLHPIHCHTFLLKTPRTKIFFWSFCYNQDKRQLRMRSFFVA